jgi:hypothetical protein
MTSDADDELMARLRRIAAAAEPTPKYVTESGHAALSTRRLDEELAALLVDSALQPEIVRGSDDGVRLLVFESGQVSVELQVEDAGIVLSVRGLVTGASGEVVVESAGVRRPTPIDPEGWFSMSGLPHGATRMHLRAGGGPVITDWVLI